MGFNLTVLLLLTIIMSSCSKNAGRKPLATTLVYNGVFQYQVNDLEPGEGSRDVSATGILSCTDDAGQNVEAVLCGPISDAPKLTQRSPAGVVSYPVAGSVGGFADVPVSEGEDFFGLTLAQREVRISSVLTCMDFYRKDTANCVDGIKQITAYAFHTCTIATDNSVKCTGLNSFGQLGLGDTLDRSTPGVSVEFSGAKGIALGEGYTCIIASNDDVGCIGSNSYGKIGLGGVITDVATLTNVPEWSGAKEIVMGDEHTCAIMISGSVKCAGRNYDSHMGAPIGGTVTTPTEIPAWAGAKQLALGAYSTCAIMSDDTVRCSGGNSEGQLGIGSTVRSNTPVNVPGFNGAKQISAGFESTCAIMGDDTVKCTGKNSLGQLGIGSTVRSTTPVDVPGFNGAKQISLGGNFACAIMGDDTVRCTGQNSLGQLGLGDTTQRTIPVEVPGFANAKKISAGVNHFCAIMSDATVKCSGLNTSGQLGDGSVVNKNLPSSSGF